MNSIRGYFGQLRLARNAVVGLLGIAATQCNTFDDPPNQGSSLRPESVIPPTPVVPFPTTTTQSTAVTPIVTQLPPTPPTATILPGTSEQGSSVGRSDESSLSTPVATTSVGSSDPSDSGDASVASEAPGDASATTMDAQASSLSSPPDAGVTTSAAPPSGNGETSTAGNTTEGQIANGSAEDAGPDGATP